MGLLKQWRDVAYSQQADKAKLQKFWAEYFVIEKGIYEQLLSNPDEVVRGTVKELADKYKVNVMTMTGFLDGINDSLKVQVNSHGGELWSIQTKDGAEYLFVSDRHPRRYVIEDGGAEVKTVLISGDHNVSAVKHKRRALFDAFIYPAGDTGLMRGVHQRTEVRRFIVGGANL